MSFTKLGLVEPILRAVAETGYTQPTPIQQKAIPVILTGQDVLAGAQTGTGKTAGFTLPMIQLLSTTTPQKGKRTVRALVLTPTRELAAQVGESVKNYGKYLPLCSTIIFGGVNINPQVNVLRSGVDIVIATPGRLLDHVNQNTVDLSTVQILVLDEADRMLDMGFIHDIKKIFNLLPKNRQNLLFSATFSKEIQTLADSLLNKPELIEVAQRNKTSDRVQQKVHLVSSKHKRAMLSSLIKYNDWEQVLVFTRTKHGANRLSKQLMDDGITADVIHGNKSQNSRTKALKVFKENKVRVLVATDIAARGLDIDQLPHVVNFELPNIPEDYVHRIGRTGRAGNEGEAVSLVCPEEMAFLKNIEKLIKAEIKREEVEGFDTPLIKDQTVSTKPARKRPEPKEGTKNNQRQRPEQKTHNARNTQRPSERKPRNNQNSSSRKTHMSSYFDHAQAELR